MMFDKFKILQITVLFLLTVEGSLMVFRVYQLTNDSTKTSEVVVPARKADRFRLGEDIVAFD